MVGIFEYDKDGRKYCKDTKLGRRSRVPGKKEKSAKPRKESESKGLKMEGRKKKRFHPGTVALWEMMKFQKATGLLIRKLPFARWVREITQQMRGNLCFEVLALLALQEAPEAYIVYLFEDRNLYAIHTENNITA